MKPKNKERKGKKRMDKESNNRAFGIYQENKHGFLTPYKCRSRKPKYGAKKSKNKDHR